MRLAAVALIAALIPWACYYAFLVIEAGWQYATRRRGPR